MIYKYTGKLLADCSGKKSCCNGRVNTTWQGKENFSITDFLADLFDRVFNKGIHLTVSGTFADTKYEVGQHCLSFYRMKYFRMELNCIQFLFCVFCCCYRAVCCMCRDFKSRCRFGNVICMAHPNDCFFWYVFENAGVFFVNQQFCLTIFADICFFNFTAKDMHHKLSAVAKSKNRNTQFKQLLLISRWICFVAAVRAAGKDNSLRIHRFNLLKIGLVWIDFAIYIAFSDTSCNQLIVLTAKINNNN